MTGQAERCCRVEVRPDGGRPEVLIDGQPVRCRAVEVRFEVGRLPRVVLEPSVVAADTRAGEAWVATDETVRALLIAHGWTPPPDPEAA